MRGGKYRGFTLAELLIVIVIIGMLAAAMMLSSGSATDSASATKIINDLRQTKAAGMLIYADEGLTAVRTAYVNSYGELAEKFDRLMGKSVFAGGSPEYALRISRSVTTGRVLIGIEPDGAIPAGVSARLAARARDVGLLGADGSPYSDGSAGVYMHLN